MRRIVLLLIVGLSVYYDDNIYCDVLYYDDIPFNIFEGEQQLCTR